MESDLLGRAEAFLKQTRENDPPPVVLEEGEGENVELNLGLGVFDINNPSTISPEEPLVSLPQQQQPPPLIQEITHPNK